MGFVAAYGLAIVWGRPAPKATFSASRSPPGTIKAHGLEREAAAVGGLSIQGPEKLHFCLENSSFDLRVLYTNRRQYPSRDH